MYVKPSTAASKTPTYQVYCFGGLQRLRNTKEALSRFLPLTNGRGEDAEDCIFTLVGTPRPAFAEIIRDRLVIHKRREAGEASPAQLAARAAFAARQRIPAVQAAE